jgi:hypothetical protein
VTRRSVRTLGDSTGQLRSRTCPSHDQR